MFWKVLEGFCRILEGAGGFLQIFRRNQKEFLGVLDVLEAFCRVVEGLGGV